MGGEYLRTMWVDRSRMGERREMMPNRAQEGETGVRDTPEHSARSR